MAIARKCDICGTLYEFYEDGNNCMILCNIGINYDIKSKKTYNICRKCGEAIEYTMSKLGKEVNSNADT